MLNCPIVPVDVVIRRTQPGRALAANSTTSLAITLAAGLALLAAMVTPTAAGEPPRAFPGAQTAPRASQAAPPAWSQSPFHRLQDGDAKTIPCRCSVQGRLVPLGTTVCMQTHLGTQLARCDLSINTTTWVPTGLPCETSSNRSRQRPPA